MDEDKLNIYPRQQSGILLYKWCLFLARFGLSVKSLKRRNSFNLSQENTR